MESESESESEKKYDFIYAGSISYRKQVRLLCESFFEYNKEGKYNLCVLGDGPDLLELKDKYQSEYIFFKGSVGNVFAYLNQSKFFISPSLSEGLPNAVLEAYSLGLPCLLSNIGPHMELVSGCDVLEKLSFNINKADIVRSLTLANSLSRSDCSLASIFEKNLISSELNALVMSNKHFDLYEEVILFNGK
nr:glycosyltransferase family 4 protein [Aeromonas caviae]